MESTKAVKTVILKNLGSFKVIGSNVFENSGKLDDLVFDTYRILKEEIAKGGVSISVGRKMVLNLNRMQQILKKGVK